MTRTSAAAALAILLTAGLQTDAAESARLRFLAAAYADAGGTALSAPEAVACGPGAQVIVGDTGNDRLVRFTWDDRALAPAGEIKTPELSAPSRVRVNAKGEIYALDRRRRRLVRFAADGTFERVVTLEGVPLPATTMLKDFAIGRDGGLYVLDAFAGRVLEVSAGGQVGRAVPVPAEAAFASSLDVDAQGTLLLLDSTGRRLFAASPAAGIFSPLGDDLSEVLATLPTSVTTTQGIILVAEGPAGTIVALGRDGTFLSRQLSRGWSEGSLNYPSQLCVTGDDAVFVADRENSRVQAFRLIR